MNIGPIQIERRQSGRSARLKEAVLASFHEPAPSVRARLAEFSLRDWERAKYWLDVSGFALYFVDRLVELDLAWCVPPSMLHQLETHMDENRARSASLLQETVSVSHALNQKNVQFAVLKGITIPPESVPNMNLRNQMDLDVLVREVDAMQARECLEELGYRLDAISGNTWEFKTGPSGMSTLKSLYQIRPERAIEIHLIGTDGTKPDRLARARLIDVGGQQISALSPADTFIFQGQHLFKHMCGEHTRAAWVLEFWRHARNRHNDVEFWRDVETLAADDSSAWTGIGAAALLTSLVFGPFAPFQLTRWSTDRLPPAICLWIQLYGRDLLLADTPGSKLYLLLRKELNPHNNAERRSRRRLMFPLHWPQRITHADDNETTARRLRRYQVQSSFALRRSWFHLVKGLDLVIESFRWNRRVAGVSQ